MCDCIPAITLNLTHYIILSICLNVSTEQELIKHRLYFYIRFGLFLLSNSTLAKLNEENDYYKVCMCVCVCVGMSV